MAATQTRTLSVPARSEPAQVELILSQIESLPTLPPVASRLLELTMDETSSGREIGELVESDQSLSARVLSMIRKADVASTVQTVDRAVVLLGSNAIRNLVLSIQVFETFSQRAENAVSRFDRLGFWRHSLAVGCAARLMAEKLAARAPRDSSVPRPEEAFVCGLLHDLGKVVFDACFPKSYDRVVEKAEASRSVISDFEREVFGVDHTVAGHRLAMHWKLPAMMRECMWLHHHSPESTPTRIAFPEHVRLVQAADRLVRQMYIGYSGNYAFEDWSGSVAGMAGLSDDEIAQTMSELPELIEARAELIGLTRTSSQEVLHETLVQTNAELARVNAALAVANRRLEQRSKCFDALCVLNRELGDEPTHEQVMEAVVRAVQVIAPGVAITGFAASPGRGLLILASAPTDDRGTRVQVLPRKAAGDLETVSEWSGCMLPDAALPGPLQDRLTAALSEPPVYCWPIRYHGRLAGAIAAPSGMPMDVDDSLRVLCDWAGSWLNTAESRFVAQQLSEELSEMNRRFVGSQAQVARMRSLAMVGEMAAGAAHEMNNPLAVISGRAQLLARDSREEETRRAALTIAEHAHRASAIVTEMMDFAKPTSPQPTDWPLDALLGEVRRTWLEKGVLSAAQFRMEISEPAPKVRADRQQIRLLFDEVIRNAVEAMQRTANPQLIVNCRADVADEKLVIRIEDNGCGMTPDVLERAMDPFFSHRPAGRGRGLGLSRAARYAEINGGKIRLSSQVKEGTAVLIDLPAAGER